MVASCAHSTGSHCIGNAPGATSPGAFSRPDTVRTRSAQHDDRRHRTTRDRPGTHDANNRRNVNRMTGRPSPIDRVIGTREVDGHTIDVTVADRIIAAIRAGSFVEHAAASAGISKATYYEWCAVAGRARIAHADNLADMTDHEQRCCTFSDAVEEARGIWLVGLNQLHERIARGDFTETTTTTKYDASGAVVERTERESPLLPDRAAIEWRLTRAAPLQYAPPERIEITGAEGEPIALSMEERASALSELARRVKGAAQQGRRRAGRSARSVSDDVVGAALPPPGSAPTSPAPPVRKAARTSSPKKAPGPGAETKAKQRRRARDADDDD